MTADTPPGPTLAAMTDPLQPERRLLCRQHVLGGDTTVAEIMDMLVEHHLAPHEVRVTGGHVQWRSPETDDELAVRLGRERRAVDREEAWERATLARLLAKYGPDAPDHRETL
jgi:hypothetical protein